jgi:hypothetical protein
MVRWILAGAVLLGLTGHAQAQGFAFGVGGVTRTHGFFGQVSGAHVSGGGGFLIKGIAGPSAEFGAIANSSSLVLNPAAHGVVHLVPSRRSTRVSPFLTAGVAMLTDGDSVFAGPSFGGGVDLWAAERLGLRLEVRDIVRTDFRNIPGLERTAHYWTVRGGVVFR